MSCGDTPVGTVSSARTRAAITASDTAEGTDDMVSVHNGAFEVAVEDLSLPNPRMPLAFTRSYRGQDDFDGPFGPGWDFDHNQRIVSAEPSVLASGVQIPLVVRDTAANSTAMGSGDVVFHNGRGDAVAYRRAPSGPVPAEYTNDALMAELGWTSDAVAFYIPQPGVFDALIRFETGQFGRLTPDGTQYWYTARGQLEKIYHRHPGTRHDLPPTPSDASSTRFVLGFHAFEVTKSRYVLGFHAFEVTKSRSRPARRDVEVTPGTCRSARRTDDQPKSRSRPARLNIACTRARIQRTGETLGSKPFAPGLTAVLDPLKATSCLSI